MNNMVIFELAEEVEEDQLHKIFDIRETILKVQISENRIEYANRFGKSNKDRPDPRNLYQL